MTQHLEILKKGVPYWNEWRENNPNVIPDLIRADLQGLDLREADLSKANLAEAILIRVDLSYSNLTRAILREVDLSEANLIRVDLSYSNLTRAILREVDLSEANLSEACLGYVDLGNANLTGANLPTDNMGMLQGDGKRIKTINTDTYCINIYDNRMQIGCKNYTIDEWFAFTDHKISTMAGDALSFWKEWKPKLQEIT